MIFVSSADKVEDFEIAAGLCRAFGEWDAVEVQPYGLDRERVLALFHTETTASLTAKFNSPEARLLIARWQGTPAGCLAFDPFDATSAELHKFYVDPQFRGKGIGRALISAAVAEIGRNGYGRIVLHTTIYMRSAISVYELFGFAACPRFRSTPDDVQHTDFFMSRLI